MNKAKPDEQSRQEQQPSGQDFLFIGIGASAGGIEALQAFFEEVPADSGNAYIVILHLSPDHDSQLASVLQRTAKIPVAQVTERVHVQPNHVYVVPPNKHLVMEDGSIVVQPNTLIEERRAPVDIFFRTLAESHGARAVSVVLSGTGANGSMGLKRVKERGGAVFVQNPREATFNEMPRNAISTDLVDEVLNVADIPARIQSYKTGLSTVHIQAESIDRTELEQQALRELFSQLRLRTGHDFSAYKRPTVLRRLERRISIHGLADLPAYLAFIQQNPEELTALLKDLLISVTNFFRDKKAFEALEQDVIPRLFKDKNSDDEVRIWIAACATGEEAYSIAMLCAEYAARMPDAPRIQLFATDIDETAIARARDGYYTLNDAADVSPERLRRFFNKEGEGYRVTREIRETVLFAHHNFIKDPPFSRLDLVSCRNVLIYLTQPAQERVMEIFHFALRPAGYLFLGTAESADSAADLYGHFSREQHIYQSRAVKARSYPVPETAPAYKAAQTREATPASHNTAPFKEQRITFGELHQRMLEQYAPPSLVVNSEYDIVHTTERAAQYLQMSGGELSRNLFVLIRQELRLELRSALYQAAQQRAPVEARGLKVDMGNHTETVNIHIRPVPDEGDGAQGFILILFEPVTDAPASDVRVLAADMPIAQHLEEELTRLKAQLRSSNEHHEYQAEELKASNEELQAMNEELRSAAEELETSKEELQSINEELSTVNQELKIKVEELSMTSSNLQNLINSTDIGTIFLDRSLRVALFTPPVTRVFNLIQADYGRALSDITSRLPYDNMLEDAETVLEKLTPTEREVRTSDGHIYLARTSPYRTEEDRINGVVITFLDITGRKKAEEGVRQAAALNAFRVALSDALRPLTDPIAIQEETVRVLALQLDVDNAHYTEIYEEAGYYRVQREYAREGAPSMLGEFPMANFGWLGPKLLEDNPIVIHNTQASPLVPAEARAAVAGINAMALITVPLIKNNQLVAALSVMTTQPREWSAQDIELVSDTAERTWANVERAIAEAALRESEASNRITMETAVDYAIISTDSEHIIKSWSRGAERIFGWLEEEVTGLSIHLIFTPEDRAAGVPETEVATATRDGYALDERWHLRKDGSRFFMSGIIRPIMDGGVQGFVKVARDLTDQRQAGEALRVSEERYRVALQSADMAAWDWNVIEDKVQWNVQHFLLLGLEPREGALSADYGMQFIHPDDRQAVEKEMTQAVEESGVYRMDAFRIIQANTGEERWMTGYGRTVAWQNGRAARMVGVMYDITENIEATISLRDKRLKLEIAQRAARIGIWGFDLLKNQGIATPEWNELTGYPNPGETFETDEFMKLVHPDDRRRVLEAHEQAARERGNEETEFRLQHPTRGVLWLLKRGQYIPPYSNVNVSLMGSLIDITERKEMEQQKEQFIGIASHELRTPVTSIKAYAEILEEIFAESG